MTAVPSAAASQAGKPSIARKRRSTAPTHPSRFWTRWGFRAAVALCAAVLAAHAYVVGHGAPTSYGGFAHGLLSATSSKGAAVIVAIAIAIVAAWCFRRVWLERLATGPGRIEVPTFTAGSPLSNGADAAHLTAVFRQRLATLRLQSPTPVPGSAPAGDFLEVLGNGTVDAKNPLATLLSVLRAAKPSHAWEVSGVLVERDEAPRYGVTVQVSGPPVLGAPPDPVFDYSWERAMTRAADRATAHILPHTRTCRSPWASWRGYVMPPALIEHYEHAVDMETQRRYDHALSAYYEALRFDPLNLPVRLQLGQLQEKLGLYLDALSTYQGIIGVSRTGEARDEDRQARAERWCVLLAAKYRRVVLLGGPALAHQWFRPDSQSNPERNAQRRSLRERLRLELGDGLASCGRRKHSTPVHELLKLAESADVPEERRVLLERELRDVLARYAVEQLADVHRCLRKARRFRHNERRLPVTALGLELTKVCIDVRLRWLRAQLRDPETDWAWPPRKLRKIEREISRHGPMRRWHEHYTAACAFALPLLVDVKREKDRDWLAEKAVALLKQATACADSGYFASRRDWVLSEDPDLDGLREHPLFKAFEASFLPSGTPTPRRPRSLQRLEATRYTDQLFVAGARRCAVVWRRRSEATDRAGKAMEWWRRELVLWQAVRRAAENYRHWRARLELLRAVDELSAASGEPPLDVAFRRYDEPTLGSGPEDPNDRVDDTKQRSRDRFKTLVEALTPAADQRSPLLAAIDGWMAELRRRESHLGVLGENEIASACHRHAALWEQLAEWLAADSATQGADAFGEELGRTVSYLTGESR